MTVPLAIGIGCRRDCSTAAILTVIREATAGRRLDAAVLFTHERKRNEAGLRDAAERLGLPLTFLSTDALAAEAERVSRRSERVDALLGIPSVAEAAALAGAGPGSRLIVGRVTHELATCAVAVGQETSA